MKTESEIVDLWDSQDILCSVACTTFNQANFITDAINGFLSQETTFPVEFIIYDDASNDGTREIIEKYQKLYPKIIKPIFQNENQKSKGIKPSLTYIYPVCQGKYIAKCEGDDYWTDPLKLQKQVDFLETNEDFAVCHHNLLVTYDDPDKKSHFSNPAAQKEVTTIEDLSLGNYIFTASCMFRHRLYEFPDWLAKCPIGDYPTHMLNAQFGKIKYFQDVMGVYRVHKDGIWENKSEIYRTEKWVDLLDHMKTKFAPEINKILIEKQNIYSEFLMMHYSGNAGKCHYYACKLLENDPFYAVNLKLENRHVTENINMLKEELNSKDVELKLKQESLDLIILGNRLNRIQKIRNIVYLLIFYHTIKQRGLFDEIFYLKNNPDVKKVGINPLKHYLLYGGFEGRKPCRSFDSKFYLIQNQDVLKSGMNPLIHYILYGKKERRPTLQGA
jgi:glycosyltransferase involved in cell wall biosynthesis